MNDWAWVTEYIRPWIATIGILVTNGVAVRAYVVWRKGKSDDLKTETDGDGKLRDHYATELQSLRDQIVKSGEGHAKRAIEAEERHRNAMAAADIRFDRAMTAADEREAACQAEVRELRREVVDLSNEVIGLRRQLGQSSRSAIVLATQTPNLGIEEAADRAATALTAIDDNLHALPHATLREPPE